MPTEVLDPLYQEFQDRLPQQQATSLEQLPIQLHAQEIINALRACRRENRPLMIIGETGSGKTTRMPVLARAALGENARILITEPRRDAADEVAEFVAANLGTRVGDIIGVRHKNANSVSENTRITFTVEQSVLNMLQEDPLLRQADAVVVDEIHERNRLTDILVGLLKRAQQFRKEQGLPPLTIIPASATLEKEKIQAYFAGAKTIDVPGRLHRIDYHYEDKPLYDDERPNSDEVVKAAAEKVIKLIHGGVQGDFLIFLPGEGEVSKVLQLLGQADLDCELLPLHSRLAKDQKKKAFQLFDKRKIVASTNIAETTVTIPVKKGDRLVVIDSGLIRQTMLDEATGIESLQLVAHARSGCDQRAGRAGRTSAGECHRLYTKDQYEKRQRFQTPEILRSNLAETILYMKSVGIDDVYSFDFIDTPKKESISQALLTLTILGALNSNGQLTEVGKLMADLHLEPHLGRMVVDAATRGAGQTACTIAALAEQQRYLFRDREKRARMMRKLTTQGSEYLALLNLWDEYQTHEGDQDWIKENALSNTAFTEAGHRRKNLLDILRQTGVEIGNSSDRGILEKSIAAGFVDKLMVHIGQDKYQSIIDPKIIAQIERESALHGNNEKYIIAGGIRAIQLKSGKGNLVLAQNCQRVDPQWLGEIAPDLYTIDEQGNIVFNKPEIQKHTESEPLGKNDEAKAVSEAERIMEEVRSHVASEPARSITQASQTYKRRNWFERVKDSIAKLWHDFTSLFRRKR